MKNLMHKSREYSFQEDNRNGHSENRQVSIILEVVERLDDRPMISTSNCG
ncbi:MAG: hypothetical protein ACLQPD_18545 [Desulfomonilaceae bacterium]